MSRSGAPSFAVIGADHLHLFELVGRLVDGGAVATAHAPLGGLATRYADWRPESTESTVEEILDVLSNRH